MRAAAPLIAAALGAAAAAAPPRVRKELRTLSPAERGDLFAAVWAMRRVGLDEGRAAYGADYQPLDYFVIKHAAAVFDQRGDQAHHMTCFMSFHRALLLEYEASLLSILRTMGSSLSALPYWDSALDADTGRYFRDPDRWIFSRGFFGSHTGNASEGYVVTDGQFARFPIARYNTSLVPQAFRAGVEAIYDRKYARALRAGSLLRSPGNPLATPYITRFPKTPGLASDGGGGKMPDGYVDIVYTESDWRLCADPNIVRDWPEWDVCIGRARARGRASDSGIFNFASGIHYFHGQMHIKVGGYQGPWRPVDNETLQGDFTDLATSVNEPFFPFHHANVDRHHMTWQRAAAARDPGLPARAWGFPANYTAWKAAWALKPPELADNPAWGPTREGCGLHMVASSQFPFTQMEGVGEVPAGITHFDIIHATNPGAPTLRYTYDTL